MNSTNIILSKKGDNAKFTDVFKNINLNVLELFKEEKEKLEPVIERMKVRVSCMKKLDEKMVTYLE